MVSKRQNEKMGMALGERKVSKLSGNEVNISGW